MSVRFDAGYCPRCDKKVMSFKQAIGLAGHAAHFVATMMATPFWGVVWVAHMIDTAFRPWLCAQCGTKTLPYSSAYEDSPQTTKPHKVEEST